MANPVTGVRIPVKLPWKGATDDKDQFVAIKEPVAKFLKFDSAKRSELEYQVDVQKKDEEGKKISGTTKVTRRRRPGYRQRSVKLTFEQGGKNNKTGKKVKVGKDSYASIQFPITTSVPIASVIEYFETGKGKGLGVLKVTDVNSGQGYNLIQD